MLTDRRPATRSEISWCGPRTSSMTSIIRGAYCPISSQRSSPSGGKFESHPSIHKRYVSCLLIACANCGGNDLVIDVESEPTDIGFGSLLPFRCRYMPPGTCLGFTNSTTKHNWGTHIYCNRYRLCNTEKTFTGDRMLESTESLLPCV